MNGQCYNTKQLIDDDSVVYDERTVLYQKILHKFSFFIKISQ